ncbi:MAG: hypothetical protein FJZ86_12090 [Chloroflexi bacterium]|nr:hypothetical protein [Chloroflexota bacterium]
MKRMKWIALILAAALLVGCAPTVTVSNTTSFPVRAIVRSGTSSVLSPSPGESSSAEVTEGAYRVTVIPDAEWIEYAKLTRQVLNDQLAHADQLTGPQLLDVIRRLKEIALQMQAFEQAAGAGTSCGGKLGGEGADSAFVTVTQDASGALVVTCR